ncbi:MAG: ImpA family type VI secretion system protein, partial [Enterobacteriaceae bacterium]
MATVETLISACQANADDVAARTQQRLSLWENWLQPVSAENPVGEDPGYDDDFQQMREEVNKLSGADTDLVCQLAEKLLTTTTKDIRVVSYYAWARLHRDGEAGLADGLELMAALVLRYGVQLHPQRERSRLGAFEWLASVRMLDSLARYPEVNNADTLRSAGALLLLEQAGEIVLPAGLYTALETRLQKSGGPEAVVPQNVSDTGHTA